MVASSNVRKLKRPCLHQPEPKAEVLNLLLQTLDVLTSCSAMFMISISMAPL